MVYHALAGLVSPAFQQALDFCEDICRLACGERIGIRQADKGVACGVPAGFTGSSATAANQLVLSNRLSSTHS